MVWCWHCKKIDCICSEWYSQFTKGQYQSPWQTINDVGGSHIKVMNDENWKACMICVRSSLDENQG